MTKLLFSCISAWRSESSTVRRIGGRSDRVGHPKTHCGADDTQGAGGEEAARRCACAVRAATKAGATTWRSATAWLRFVEPLKSTPTRPPCRCTRSAWGFFFLRTRKNTHIKQSTIKRTLCAVRILNYINSIGTAKRTATNRRTQ